MIEPDNLTLVLIGSLADNDPWDLELWARDDAVAQGSNARWIRAGLGGDNPNVHCLSWQLLEERARDRGFGDKLTVLGTGAL